MNEHPLDMVGFLQSVIGALEDAGVDYMIGGAIAAWAWGEPRATQDLDLVVNIPLEAVNRLSEALRTRDMLVPAEIILDALIENRADLPINAIHLYSGLKADLYPVREGDDLRQEAFNRRQVVDFGPPIGMVFVHSPEDLIVYKLIYYSISHQSKHIRDISAILQSRKNLLDLKYIEKWAGRSGLTAIWREIYEAVSDE